MSTEFLLIFWAVLFFTAVFFAWYFVRRPKESERRLLIEKALEKDLDLQKLMDLPAFQNSSFSFKFPWLKLGIITICTALGFGTGILLSENSEIFDLDFIPILFFLFGGIGLILAHFLGKKYDV